MQSLRSSDAILKSVDELRQMIADATAARDAEIARLQAELDALRTAGADDLAGEVLRLRIELDATRVALRNTTMALIEMHAEYKSLWDAAIEYINAPGNSSEVEYSALMLQAMKSRFWKDNA